ncbi:sugar phosphate exchanger [Achlya hypogyna]|uniref:Sugar phosphate exchanger n=1 Tax=Achlya hypogyna TaxID=1202772 RepID=A0A1V9ZEE6_ACHHY|nr:sugar phosphate exchanger [Achlya hypogyna]
MEANKGDEDPRLWVMKARTFAITFFSYAMFHVARKSFSSIKGELGKEEWMQSSLTTSQSNMYGIMDMVFMGCYASGLYVSGMMGDRVDLRLFITLGMFCTGASLIVFGLAGFADIHAFAFFVGLWGINGLVQSCGWPSNVAVMSRWFGHNERGVAMGLWSGCSSFGNIFGGALVGLLCTYLDATIAWKVTLLVAGGLLWALSLVVCCFLVPDPKDLALTSVPIETPETPPTKPNILEPQDLDKPKHLPGISFWRAWLIPGVLPYALAYACIKSVSYSLFFWVPYYLSVAFSMETSRANFYSILYDFGAIIGAVLGGFITDRMEVRSPYVVASLVCATLVLHFLHGATEHGTATILFALGLLTGGPETLITTAISADLGMHPSLLGNAQALATVAGIIDGTGSFGAALMQFVVGAVAHCEQTCSVDGDCTTTCGWWQVFTVLQVMLVVGMLCLSKMVYQDVGVLCRPAPRATALTKFHSRDLAGRRTQVPVMMGDADDFTGGTRAETPSHNPDDIIPA